MSFSEIEAELGKLTAEELRCLAVKSWTAFVEKEGSAKIANECSEDDPQLLASLDEAIARADANPGRGYSGSEVLARLRGWTSK